MKRMVLVALMVFCSLLFLGEEKASAIPYTFTWDVSGLMDGRNLGASDASSWSARFSIQSTDLSWSDTWGDSGAIQNTSGDVAYNIDYFNAVTYDLALGQTYHVDWRITAEAHVEDGPGHFDWAMDAGMDRSGSALWPALKSSVAGFVLDSLGTDAYAQSDPISAAGSASYGLMTAESAAAKDGLKVQGSLFLNPNVYSADGYSEAVFSGTLQVVPDVMPVPGGLMLGAFGIGIVGWLRGRRTL